ncbi:hypothetical protein [Tissierella praeacuta]|uniref:hypothetical protein n=1 Tax=Tissierella praeacuta TaxID=43131 RepID=UPI002FDB5FD1
MKDHDIECLAMAIVNHTNEINNVDVDVDIRQRNNDLCFDYARDKIKDYIIGIDLSEGKDWTPIPPYK